MTRVLVVDDHDLFAQILIRFLSSESDLEIVGLASSGHEALSMIEALSPDVVVLDYGLPGGDGPSVCREIRARWPETGVIMLSGYPDELVEPAARAAGCTGFLTKTQAVDELADMIRSAHSSPVGISTRRST